MSRKLFKEFLNGDEDTYNVLIDSIQHNIFDKFRRFGGDKPALGLYEKEITISYKDINDICYEGAKDFINNLKLNQ